MLTLLLVRKRWGDVMSAHMRTLVVTSLALFAMFFGAGNLIVPVMIGADAGITAWSAAIGFVSTGVLLPVLSMVAMSTLREGELRLADRLGARMGLIVTTLIFLFTGMFYAIPRVGAVSFEMAFGPYLSTASEPTSQAALAVYSALFFAGAFAIVRSPKMVIRSIGVWLTPALLVLLVVLIAGAWAMPATHIEPTGLYVASPVIAGFIQGYFTMDALAALMFGGVVISSLKAAGFNSQQVHRGTATAGMMAGVFLTFVYVGLVRVGQVGTGSNGAALTARVARDLFGPVGQTFFGLIVVLACLTTALGLLGASVDYFNKLVPQVSRQGWLIIATLVSFVLTNLGLERILAVVAPANQLLYPIVMVLVVATLLDLATPNRLYFAYRVPAWITAGLALLEALYSTSLSMFLPLRSVLDIFPFGHLQMAWIIPAGVAFLIGLGADVYRGRLTKGL
ncbi:LIV-II [Arcanobacterium haemolyticum]|nr:LIV-II [Arcanobacterium haemolyticum]